MCAVSDIPIKSGSLSSTGRSESVRVVGVRFDRYDLNSILNLFRQRDATDGFSYVVTVNVDHMLRLQASDGSLLAIYEAAWLSLCDSRVLRLIARISHIDLGLALGSDLTAMLFDRLITKSTPVTIIGSSLESVALLRHRFGLQRIHHHIPPMGFIHQPEEVAYCVSFVEKHPAEFVFICVGSPQQEVLAASLADSKATTGIGLCVGAAIDFASGIKRRAPLWMQRAHLEWMHRLYNEPRRLWRRYLLKIPALLQLMYKIRMSDKNIGKK